MKQKLFGFEINPAKVWKIPGKGKTEL